MSTRDLSPGPERRGQAASKAPRASKMTVSARQTANPREQFPLVKSLRKLYVVLKLYNCYYSLFKNYLDLIDQLD